MREAFSWFGVRPVAEEVIQSHGQMYTRLDILSKGCLVTQAGSRHSAFLSMPMACYDPLYPFNTFSVMQNLTGRGVGDQMHPQSSFSFATDLTPRESTDKDPSNWYQTMSACSYCHLRMFLTAELTSGNLKVYPSCSALAGSTFWPSRTTPAPSPSKACRALYHDGCYSKLPKYISSVSGYPRKKPSKCKYCFS